MHSFPSRQALPLAVILLAGSGFGYGSGAVPAAATNLVVSEFLFEPSLASAAEQAAGFVDQNDFEFIELLNISEDPVDLQGVGFGEGIRFGFSGVLGAGQYLVVVRDGGV